MTSTQALSAEQIRGYVDEILSDSEHHKRRLSVANGVLGVVHAAAISIHAIGAALAQAQGLNPKHATKQVDRLLSNRGFDLRQRFADWVGHLMRGPHEVLVALDWTDYDADDQATVSLALATDKGRAQPLMWKTVAKSTLKAQRNRYEDELLTRFHECLPQGVHVTITADRGFADQKLFSFLQTLGFDYIIRIKGSTTVYQTPMQGRAAHRWLNAHGHVHTMRQVYVTQDFAPVATFVSVHKAGMTQPWFLVSSRSDLSGTQMVGLYQRRFTIEEMFRDEKDPRFGLGLSATRIKSPQRRDRLLFLAALARDLLTVLGAAAESLGMDRLLKVNTVKRRTHSLYRQGCYFYGALPRMKPDSFAPLMQRFGEMIQRNPLYISILGISPC